MVKTNLQIALCSRLTTVSLKISSSGSTMADPIVLFRGLPLHFNQHKSWQLCIFHFFSAIIVPYLFLFAARILSQTDNYVSNVEVGGFCREQKTISNTASCPEGSDIYIVLHCVFNCLQTFQCSHVFYLNILYLLLSHLP